MYATIFLSKVLLKNHSLHKWEKTRKLDTAACSAHVIIVFMQFL